MNDVVYDKDAINKLIEMMKGIEEPDGIILLPNGDGYTIYKYPVSSIKGALVLLSGNFIDDKMFKFKPVRLSDEQNTSTY